mmetsp:Transcript_52409/g.59908  ORF Transcript_52409/g.59908 Transcript_52409/m.59908 type:complete len:197 (-) Transcript_52409:257-847(-)
MKKFTWAMRAPLFNVPKAGFSWTYPCPRLLRELTKMSAIEREQPSTIKQIWTDYHKEKEQTISSFLEPSHYRKIVSRGRASPMFVFPVWKPQGHYVMLMQAQNKSFLFTFLEDFKKNPLGATPYLVLTIFDELEVKKGLVLVRGDIVNNQMSKEESLRLMNLTFDHYMREELFGKIHQFNHEPNSFNFDEFIQQCR